MSQKLKGFCESSCAADHQVYHTQSRKTCSDWMTKTSCSQTILSGDKWRICLDLARQILGHQSRLHLDTAPGFDPGAEGRMRNFLIQSLLKAREEKLARLRFQPRVSQFDL